MVSKKRHVAGVTIFETLLVLAVMGAILVFSIQQYLLYKRDADIRIVQANVDLLFYAMEKQFRTNCNYPGTIFAKYYDNQYLTDSLFDLTHYKYLILKNNTLPPSPIVNADGQDQGYRMQFNQIQNKDGTLPQRTIQTANGKVNTGSIVLWQIQVSVELKDQDNAKLYKNLLGADCLSTVSGYYVLPCDQAPTDANQFAVWMRLPSYASSEANAAYWQMKPNVKQFSQMYSTNPILSLTNGTLTSSQYYTCGGG